MGERAEALAAQFERLSDELTAEIEQRTDEQWRSSFCKGEGWSVGVTAHHIAVGISRIAGEVRAMASGQPFPPVTEEQLDKANEQHARQHEDYTKEETLELLRRDVPSAVSLVRKLSDEQLSRSATVFATAPPLTTEQFIQRILIGHAVGHLESMRAAL